MKLNLKIKWMYKFDELFCVYIRGIKLQYYLPRACGNEEIIDPYP